MRSSRAMVGMVLAGWVLLLAVPVGAAAPGCDVLDAIAASCRFASAQLDAAVATPGDAAAALGALAGDVANAQAALAAATAPPDLVAQRGRLAGQLAAAASRAGRAASPSVGAAARQRLLDRIALNLGAVDGILSGAAQLDHCDGPGPFLGGSLAGRRLFPADNWWNLDVSQAPVAQDSDAVIDFIGRATSLHPDFGTDFGIPYVVVGGRQAKIPMTFGFDDQSDHGAPGLPLGYPIPEQAKTVAGFIEGGIAGGGPRGDRHLLLVDRDHWLLFEMYAMRWTGAAWTGGSGAIFDLNRNDRRPDGWTSADAAGLAILPGLVRADEVFEQGRIDHAVRFTVRGTQGYVYPASHDATSGPGGDARPPMGLRVRLKAGVDAMAFAPPVRVILRAMKRYGMIIADNGSDWFVSGAPDPRWDDALMHDEFARLTGDDFEVVAPPPAAPAATFFLSSR